MTEHPPGYEVEEPVDLFRPLAELVSATNLNSRGKAESRLIVVANVLRGSYKTTTARMLCGTLRSGGHPALLWDRTAQNATADLPDALANYAGFLVVDTNTRLPSGTWRTCARLAHQLVIPVPVDREAAQAVKWMCARLELDGLGDLVREAMVLATRGRNRDRKLAKAITSFFGERAGDVIEIPAKEKAAKAAWRSAAGVIAARLDAQPAPPELTRV